ncbi:MAG: HNH endonuclease [Bacteroidetes bacterium]|nr:MAG: HNH endonuclease [Bacteroidota bacterium]
MARKDYPDEFWKLVKSISNKRAKIVIEHILKHGHISTEDIKKKYGYSHPPRAARDVREAGIPLETFKVRSEEGKSIAAYRFGDLNKIQKHRFKGRRQFSKKFKKELYLSNDGRCYVCNGKFESRYLQIDHRIPYEISGDSEETRQTKEDFMLLCASCNRAKSWSCENCKNWLYTKDGKQCLKCYWGTPVQYNHIALQPIKRLELIWQGAEISFFETLQKESERKKASLQDFVKEILKSQFLPKE